MLVTLLDADIVEYENVGDIRTLLLSVIGEFDKYSNVICLSLQYSNQFISDCVMKLGNEGL